MNNKRKKGGGRRRLIADGCPVERKGGGGAGGRGGRFGLVCLLRKGNVGSCSFAMRCLRTKCSRRGGGVRQMWQWSSLMESGPACWNAVSSSSCRWRVQFVTDKLSATGAFPAKAWWGKAVAGRAFPHIVRLSPGAGPRRRLQGASTHHEHRHLQR